MRFGILSGALWGLDTVVLAMAVALAPFLSSGHTPLASAALHDLACAVILFLAMAARGRLGDTWRALHTRSGQVVMGAALLGGPIGMSGYLLAINNIGPGPTAVMSTFYPAFGTLLAFFLLKERMHAKQVVALSVALGAVMLAGWSSESTATGSVLVGALGALACVIGWGSEAVLLTWGLRDDAVDNQTALHIRQSTSALSYLLVVLPLSGALGFTASAALTPAAAIVALAGLAGTLSYLFYYRALGSIGASRGMALNISYSAWAIIFALLLQGTVPTLTQALCCLVILCGTVLAATPAWGELLGRSRQS